MTTGYPAILVLDGRTGVVVGGGKIAERKVQTLIDAGAQVRLISTALTAKLGRQRDEGAIEVHERPYQRGDLKGAAVVIAATDDNAVNRAVYGEAVDEGIPVNVVDDVPYCTFIAPSIVRRGDLMIAISTGGKAPALAVRLRERLEREIGEEYAEMISLLGDLREDVTVPGDEDERRDRWYRVVDSDVFDLVRAGRIDDARERAKALLSG